MITRITVQACVAMGLLTVAALAGPKRVCSHIQQAADMKVQPALETEAASASGDRAGYAPVGIALQPTTDSRGALIAQTFNDVPSNVNAGRMVAITPASATPAPAGVHFAILFRDNPLGINRLGYGCYDPLGAGTFPIPGGKVIMGDPGSNEGGAFPKVMALPDGRAIVSGQSFLDAYSGSFIHVSKDLASMAGEFGTIEDGSIMDSATNQSGNYAPGNIRSVWPYSCLDINGSGANDTVTYLWTTGGSDRSYFYIDENKVFRKIGTLMPGVDTGWALVFVDSGNGFRGGGIACDPTSSRVAIFTTLPPSSDLTGAHGLDVRWADSPTGASGTWTKHNLTNITSSSLDIPWLEVEGMFDSQGKLHLVFNAVYNGDGNTYTSIQCRGLHWSEHDSGKLYVFYDAHNWPLTDICGRNGFNVMNIGQLSISECENRLYIVYSAANDPKYVTNLDDCVVSQPGFTNSGNGEIFLTISKDLVGRSWDVPRNVSNSYTPNCDTGTCACDNFPSLSLYSMDDADYAGSESWSNAQSTWDPSGGSYTGSQYLQLYYLQDKYPSRAGVAPGGINIPPYTLNDMRWVRMACAPPIEAAALTLSRDSITWPEWHRPGDDTTYNIVLTATGNTDLIFTSILDIEDSAKGPGAGPTGWLALGDLPSSIPEGGVDTISVTLNAGGVITGGTTVLFGKVRFSYSPPAQNKDLIVQFPVADTVVQPVWDTISTSCLDLAVSSDGNMGHGGGDSSLVSNGKVNMDYAGHGDCDTGSNSRGNAAIYLFSGSPMIVRQTGPTTYRGSWTWAPWTHNPLPWVNFRPVAGCAPHGGFSTVSSDGFNSGTFVTVDSLVKVEMTWWAPKHPDSCNFIVQRLRIFPANMGAPVTNLQIGEGIDWDIPSDLAYTYVDNYSGTDPGRRMIYVRGIESGELTADCADNSRRYAGMALLNWHMKNNACYDSLYGALTFANDVYSYPGLVPDSVSRLMHLGGYAVEPAVTDISALLTFKDGPTGYTLPANDTLTIMVALATTKPNAVSTNAGLDSLKKTIDKAKNFMKKNLGICASCCQGVSGNVNMTGIVDLSDLSALVSYLTGGGFVLPCAASANVNSAGIVDLSDLSALVSYLTGGGFVLPSCL